MGRPIDGCCSVPAETGGRVTRFAARGMAGCGCRASFDPQRKNAGGTGVFAAFSAVYRVFWVAFSNLSILIIPSC
ncbi:MAG TPA: hypothetical protein VHY20_12400, partial [Pirellulales bacterium]|nr:hypothetical protein [Pirellulales bacterium]